MTDDQLQMLIATMQGITDSDQKMNLLRSWAGAGEEGDKECAENEMAFQENNHNQAGVKEAHYIWYASTRAYIWRLELSLKWG